MEMIQLSLFFMMCMVVHRSSSEILQRQKRSWIIDSFTIDEGYTGSFPYSLGTIKVEKDLSLFKIQGQGVDEDPKGILQINRETGEITVHGPVDYEKYKVFKLIFQAFDKEKNILDTQLGVEIQIKDSNDNAPKFDFERYEISIKESTVQGTDLINIRASDADTNKKDATFVFRMVSVTPAPHDLEFYLHQKFVTQSASISFRGCVDHERAEKYTIVVEAKDQGEKIQLSSSCTIIINIEDGNNHLPLITGQTGPGKVKEGEENVLVTRLQATDKDTKGTKAWKAKYQIQGDTNNNFKITTDPETNEGLLYLEKALDYEENPLKKINISVENEIPYHSCKVLSRTASGLWKVVTSSGSTISGASIGGSTIGGPGAETLSQSTYQMTVTVEDVNEPPIFDKPNKQVTLGENVKAGQYLETFTARDCDTINANTFVYSKGHDPAGWITVDPVTGKITTAKGFDRESAFVNNSIYTVTIHAVDDGKPPMTGTATLSIHITDENDNTPTLDVNTIDMCQSHGPSVANITVSDLDEDPYGGPFMFKLHGDVEGKWRVDPPQGYSLNLVKENTVHSGPFNLLVEVFDRQHKSYVHNLSVTVCNCLDMTKPNCRYRSATTSTAGGGAIGIIFFGILLLAGVLLLAFMVSCNRDKIQFPDDVSGCIMNSNIEKPGTDCKVHYELLNQHQSVKSKAESEVLTMTMKPQTKNIKVAVSEANLGYGTSQMDQRQTNNTQWITTDSANEVSQGWQQSINSGNSMQVGLKYADASSSMRGRDQYRNSMRWRNSWMRSSKYSAEIHREMLFTALTTMLYNLQAPGEELGDYAPHVYAEEGDKETSFELDAISIPDISFEPDFDPDLISKFNTLASICMSHKSTAYSTETFSVTEKRETATLIRAENWKTSMITESHL